MIFSFSSDELKSPRRCTEDQCEGFDELATVGHPEDTEVSTVIEPTGKLKYELRSSRHD